MCWDQIKLLWSHKKTNSTFVDFYCFPVSGCFVFCVSFKLKSRKAERVNAFFYTLCSCRHWGDNNLSAGLFDELYQWAQATSVFFSLVVFWKQYQTQKGRRSKIFHMTFFWNGAQDAFVVIWHLLFYGTAGQWRVKRYDKFL